MTESTLVSVIIRTKDRRYLLLDAIRSVLRQSLSPLEILVVNDGGEDVADLLPDVENDAGRDIRYFDLQPGLGRAGAANHGLEQARGDWLIFLDDDDWLDGHHLEHLRQALRENPACLAAYSAVRAVFAASRQRHEVMDFAHDYDPVRLLVENYIPIHAVLFSRQLLAKGCRFDTGFEMLEDWDFWLQVSRETDFHYTGQFSAYYRIDTASGFGVTGGDQAERHRHALYRKWLPRWNDAQLLEVMNRSRLYPRLEGLTKETTELRGHLEKRADQVQALSETLVKAQRDQARTYDSVVKSQNATRQYREKLERSQQSLAAARDALRQRQQAHEESQASLSRVRQEREQLQAQSEQLRALSEKRIKDLEHQLEQQRHHAEDLTGTLNMIYGSRSWRLTRPLRQVSTALMILRSEGLRSLLGRIHAKLYPPTDPMPELGSDAALEQQWHPLRFAVPDEPLVSIVIPVFNKHLYTFHCLNSILQHSQGVSYEIIVVDDCSSDETPGMLSEMQGIRVITHAQNQGFIRSCNDGARAARGQYLVLFNNDTEPRPGWLQALLGTFDDFPDCGMAGARLVYPDGTLQEAGGIVWRDGSAWNFGRDDDANKPQYSYCREVDYCSGACLMLRTDDFAALGSFDEHYLPAYYEDTDLAFRVRQSGKKVYYQPAATIVHFEGITSGTDTGSGTKRYQDINQRKFFQRWRETLLGHRPNAQAPELEKERNVDRRVLVVDARVLMPDHDSGSLRMFSLLQVFRKLGYKVTFIPSNLQYHESYTRRMQAMGIECFYHPYLRSVEEHLKSHGSLYDLVLLSRVDEAEMHIGPARKYCGNARILFDTVDLHFLREMRQAELTHDKAMLESARIRKAQEVGIARQADMTLVVSPAEIELFRQEAPGIPLALLSNIHRVEPTEKPFDQRHDILFIGSFEHPPNVDAMFFFLDEVLPLLHASKPELTIRIVGGKVPARLKKRENERVEFTGFVADIRPLFNDTRLSVAPLRYGAGVKGKINTSMSMGVPVIATTVAAEGMGLEDGRDVLVADSAADFAAAVIRAYDDAALWAKLAEGGRANVERHFSFDVAEQQLREILSQLQPERYSSEKAAIN